MIREAWDETSRRFSLTEVPALNGQVMDRAVCYTSAHFQWGLHDGESKRPSSNAGSRAATRDLPCPTAAEARFPFSVPRVAIRGHSDHDMLWL